MCVRVCDIVYVCVRVRVGVCVFSECVPACVSCVSCWRACVRARVGVCVPVPVPFLCLRVLVFVFVSVFVFCVCVCAPAPATRSASYLVCADCVRDTKILSGTSFGDLYQKHIHLFRKDLRRVSARLVGPLGVTALNCQAERRLRANAGGSFWNGGPNNCFRSRSSQVVGEKWDPRAKMEIAKTKGDRFTCKGRGIIIGGDHLIRKIPLSSMTHNSAQ